MTLDILDIFAPSAAFRTTHGLGKSDGTTYTMWTVLTDPDASGLQNLVYVKGPKGSPWDYMTVGPNWVYQRVTENVWSDPTSFKTYLGIGARRFKRFLDVPDAVTLSGTANGPNLVIQPPVYGWQWPLTKPETNYLIVPAGTLGTATMASNGDCRCTIKGPYAGAATGDLPAGEDWLLDFERSGANGIYQALERFTHRRGYGRYLWEPFVLQNGVFIPDATSAPSLTNRIVATPPPAISIPAFMSN